MRSNVIKYHGIRKKPISQTTQGRKTHYADISDEERKFLYESFGKFIHSGLPHILTVVLNAVLPKILDRANFLNEDDDQDAIKELYNNKLNAAIFKYFKIDRYPSSSNIRKHIAGEITLTGYEIPVEIVLIYGESGIFSTLIQNFLMTAGHKLQLIKEITTWKKLEDFINRYIVHENADNYIFVREGLHCAGKKVAVSILKILLLNLVLYKNDRKHGVFIPEKFYDDSELEKHFAENFKPSEA